MAFLSGKTNDKIPGSRMSAMVRPRNIRLLPPAERAINFTRVNFGVCPSLGYEKIRFAYERNDCNNVDIFGTVAVETQTVRVVVMVAIVIASISNTWVSFSDHC